MHWVLGMTGARSPKRIEVMAMANSKKITAAAAATGGQAWRAKVRA